MLPHPLADFEKQKYNPNELRLNGVCSKGNLPKTKDGAYVTNLDEYESIATHWIALYVIAENVTYFNTFGSQTYSKRNSKINQKQKYYNKHL